jgi:hypothetical protein
VHGIKTHADDFLNYSACNYHFQNLSWMTTLRNLPSLGMLNNDVPTHINWIKLFLHNQQSSRTLFFLYVNISRNWVARFFKFTFAVYKFLSANKTERSWLRFMSLFKFFKHPTYLV